MPLANRKLPRPGAHVRRVSDVCQAPRDYLETDPAIAAKRVAIIGHTSCGKAALWCGAEDPRFSYVITLPVPDQSLLGGSIGYHMRSGKHDLAVSDWQHYLDFADQHWKR